ncbi:hypothetical protein U1Q18_022283 [Sarracenia purpurea var. burkii]
MGSHNAMESGFYMTSFAAIIFIAALLTFGVSLITLLIALIMMLQSCESKNAGIVSISKSNDNYNYCNMLTLHAELNRLNAIDFPEVCKAVAVHYIKEGQYARDLNHTIWMAENYFEAVKPLEDGLDLVLMDVDDFFPSSSPYGDPLQSRLSQFGCHDCLEEAKNLKHKFIIKLYVKLQTGGWPLILFSRKLEKQRNATMEHLISAGCGSWSSLVLRLQDEMQMDSREYFSRLRNKLQRQGFQITAVISSHMDALMGPHSGEHVFKLPNPIYEIVEHHFESASLSQ